MIARWLYVLAAVLLLVTIGGQCRGSLAQTPAWTAEEATTRVPLRTTPMTADEWAKTYDECVKDDTKAPVILARRQPGLSAGIVCVRRADVE